MRSRPIAHDVNGTPIRAGDYVHFIGSSVSRRVDMTCLEDTFPHADPRKIYVEGVIGWVNAKNFEKVQS